MAEAFSLNEIKHHDWHIQSCCALTGEGLDEGLDWLITKLSSKHSIDRSGAGGQGGENLKHITKLPDHDNKAHLTDLTMQDKDDLEKSVRS